MCPEQGSALFASSLRKSKLLKVSWEQVGRSQGQAAHILEAVQRQYKGAEEEANPIAANKDITIYKC